MEETFWDGFAVGALVIVLPVLAAIVVIALNNRNR